MLDVTFWGVRGSCPCSYETHSRYGGNTSCVVLEVPGDDPLIFDLGTGLAPFGLTQPLDGSFRASCLVTHAHWDHIQGLPFFPPVNRPGAEMDVYGPPGQGASLEEIFAGAIAPPYFPVLCSALQGKIRFHDVVPGESGSEALQIGSFQVVARRVPHPGPTLGYRVQAGGGTVAYISDHQAPPDLTSVDPQVLALCEGVDLLIHDAQYSTEEYAAKSHWGHCTVDYAVRVAALARVRTLALFHHDPAHTDDVVDALLDRAVRLARGTGVEVIAASETRVVRLGAA